MPDYMTGAIIGTAFAAGTGKSGIEVALAVAVPVGLLLVNFDLLARFVNAYFQNMADLAAEKENYKKVELANILGLFSWGASRALPIFICLFFGKNIVNVILKSSPEWLLSGLRVAAGVLPALGIAILLRYLPLKKYWAYVLVGFVAAAYLKTPMLGVAFIGLVAASVVYNRKVEQSKMAPINISQEGDTIEDDE